MLLATRKILKRKQTWFCWYWWICWPLL